MTTRPHKDNPEGQRQLREHICELRCCAGKGHPMTQLDLFTQELIWIRPIPRTVSNG